MFNLCMAKPFHMNKTLLTALVLLSLFCAKINAQTTITTWYIIPPTSGCNGVWAIDASQGACGPTYIFNPSFPVCATFSSVVADTMFLQLCSLPCSLMVSDTQGNPCAFCSTGTSVGVEESAQSITTTYPNPATSTGGWNIMLQQPGENVTVNIYNSLGQLVLTQQNSGAEQIVHVDLSSLVAGTYTASVSVNDAVAYNQQLIITQ